MSEQSAETVRCEKHDWRIDPHVILPSYPPRLRLVCADCGAVKTGPAGKAPSQDPKNWEPAPEHSDGVVTDE